MLQQSYIIGSDRWTYHLKYFWSYFLSYKLLSVKVISSAWQLHSRDKQNWLVSNTVSVGIEFEVLISNLGLDIDSGLGQVLVLVSDLKTTPVTY